MTKHWFIAFLVSNYSKKKKMGLDLGSGRRNWKEFFQCNHIGLDLPNKLNNKIKERPDISGTIVELPFVNDSFDFISCITVLPYVENVDRAFREIYRVMKPNGIALIIVQNPRGIKLHENTQNYINKFTMKTLNQRLTSYGFKSIRHKNIKSFFYSIYFDLTSVYAFAVVQK
jgi:ubiquinone/menaquinone biosynthesis C-methylase UbiE